MFVHNFRLGDLTFVFDVLSVRDDGVAAGGGVL